jgi:hypothetical protein
MMSNFSTNCTEKFYLAISDRWQHHMRAFFYYPCRQHDRAGWTFAVHGKMKNQAEISDGAE